MATFEDPYLMTNKEYVDIISYSKIDDAENEEVISNLNNLCEKDKLIANKISQNINENI